MRLVGFSLAALATVLKYYCTLAYKGEARGSAAAATSVEDSTAAEDDQLRAAHVPHPSSSPSREAAAPAVLLAPDPYF